MANAQAGVPSSEMVPVVDDSLLAIHADLNADIAIARHEADVHRRLADMADAHLAALENYRLRISSLKMGEP